MKKFLKILLCALMALALTVNFTACKEETKEKESTEEKKESEENKLSITNKDAEDVAKEFTAAFLAGDVEKAREYLSDKNYDKDIFAFKTNEEAVNDLATDFIDLIPNPQNDLIAEESFDLAAKDVAKALIELRGKNKYEIVKTEEKDGVFNVEMSIEIFSEEELQTVITDTYSTLIEEYESIAEDPEKLESMAHSWPDFCAYYYTSQFEAMEKRDKKTTTIFVIEKDGKAVIDTENLDL